MTPTVNPVRSLVHESVFHEVARWTVGLVEDAHHPDDLRDRILGHLSGKGRLLPEGRFSPWPFLTLLSYQTASGQPANAAVPAAAAIEIMVACADLIDDVQDGDTPVEGNGSAGEALESVWVMLLLAQSSLVRSADAGVPRERVLDACHRFVRWPVRAMGGQHQDIALEHDPDASLQQSLEMTALKSASLTRCAAEVGAALASSDADVIDLYGEFGRHLGMVGQLMNDIAAVWPNGADKSDLRLGKKTPPIVAGLEAARRGDERAMPVLRLFDTLQAGVPVTRALEDEVKWALWECGAIQQTWKAAAFERNAANRVVDELCTQVPEAFKLKHLID